MWTPMSMHGPPPACCLVMNPRPVGAPPRVRAGAQGYICIDDVTVEAQEAVMQHAVQRHRLQTRLSETDVSVLSILRDINDGVVVVDEHGHVLDINPAARSILGLGPVWMSANEPLQRKALGLLEDDGDGVDIHPISLRWSGLDPGF